MASLIYGVSRSLKNGLGYSESCKTLNTKPIALYEHFVPSGTHVRSSEPGSSKGGKRRPQNKDKSLRNKPHAQIELDYSKVKAHRTLRSSGKTNKKGPRKWVPKNKIIYFADIINSSIRTSSMTSDQWRLVTQKGRRAYIPRTGT